MKRIELAGSPTEMGRAQGAALREDIHAFATIALPRQASWDHLDRAVRELRDYLGSVDSSLLDEMNALADEVGLTRDEAFRLSHNEDIPGPNRGWPDAGHGCTIVMVRQKGGPARMANSMDIADRMRPLFSLRCVSPANGMSFVCTARAGFVGCSRGMNAAGLVMGGTSAPYGDADGPGVGLYVAMRHLLQNCSTTEEVLDFFRAHPPPSKGHCYGVLDRSGRGAGVEINHTDMAIRPFTGDVLVATNRFTDAGMARYNASRGPGNELSCRTRESLLTEFLGRPGREFTRDEPEEAMRLHAENGRGVCNHDCTQFVILGLPSEGKFLLADGKPCQQPFEEVWRSAPRNN